MVRYSEKQKLLNRIRRAIHMSIQDEAAARLRVRHRPNPQDTGSTSHDDEISELDLGSDSDSTDGTDSTYSFMSEDSDDWEFSATQGLIRLYVMVSETRYFSDRTRLPGPGGQEKLIHLLDQWAPHGDPRFRDMVRMTPEAFDKLALKLQQTQSFKQGAMPIKKVREIVAVALYRLGRVGNAAGQRIVALQCGCSVGSLVGATNQTIDGLVELNRSVMAFASEEERNAAKEWVRKKTGVEQWANGWLVADEAQIPLAWKPAVMVEEHYNDKGFHCINAGLVILPHSLRIVEFVIGPPPRDHGSKNWKIGSNILKAPRVYLDEGEFVWADAGYGHSAFTVEPFADVSAEKSRDLQYFNESLSQVRSRVDIAIAYLKNRFPCLKGYRGNIYRAKDVSTANRTVQACIIAHTFASRYDQSRDLAEFLRRDDQEEEMAEDEIQYILQSLQCQRERTKERLRERQANQRQYRVNEEVESEGRSQTSLLQLRISRSHDLREKMFQALFKATDRMEEDTHALSRRFEMTIEAYDHSVRHTAHASLQLASQTCSSDSQTVQLESQTEASGSQSFGGGESLQ